MAGSVAMISLYGCHDCRPMIDPHYLTVPRTCHHDPDYLSVLARACSSSRRQWQRRHQPGPVAAGLTDGPLPPPSLLPQWLRVGSQGVSALFYQSGLYRYLKLLKLAKRQRTECQPWLADCMVLVYIACIDDIDV